MPKVAFETLGCKLNQAETDAIAAGFVELGWTIAAPGEPAEAHVVNTCTVTDRADRKSRNALGHHLHGGNDPIVVVTGCFAESARESLEGKQGITYVVGNRQKNQIPTLVDAHFRGETALELPRPDPFGFATHPRVFHTRASLKIQDGCDNFCSFCIIPEVRGRAVSRRGDDIVRAAQEFVAAGRKELVLTGVNLGRWTEPGGRFSSLVRSILELEGDFRVRITSLEPDGLDDEFASLFAHPKMAPHLHLCLQSGSDRILLAMRREYRMDDYRAVAARVRAVRPDLNLTTDLIVGFPGETEDDFAQSLAVVDELRFGHVHVFPYSRRRGTRAERMDQQVTEAQKSHRSQTAQTAAAAQRRRLMAPLVGQSRRVLVETPDLPAPIWLRGLSEDYFPVRFPGRSGWNQFRKVRLVEVIEEGGEPVFRAEEA